MENQSSEHLKILGEKVTHSIEASEMECFPCPPDVTKVSFTTDEFTSNCPKTFQPDYYRVKIIYQPKELCIESKSLKLYLWRYRNTGQFCEELSHIILTDIVNRIDPFNCKVILEMAPRGGIGMESVAEYGLEKIS